MIIQEFLFAILIALIITMYLIYRLGQLINAVKIGQKSYRLDYLI